MPLFGTRSVRNARSSSVQLQKEVCGNKKLARISRAFVSWILAKQHGQFLNAIWLFQNVTYLTIFWRQWNFSMFETRKKNLGKSSSILRPWPDLILLHPYIAVAEYIDRLSIDYLESEIRECKANIRSSFSVSLSLSLSLSLRVAHYRRFVKRI